MGFDDSGSWVLTTVEIGVGFDDESVNGFFFFLFVVVVVVSPIWVDMDDGG